ncbi:Crp/Fnr family transcriptional regulator [Paraclostridium sordellii]|uniref:Crp/Fnr family transcriptional regulator n=1 Tax=Paraclostridium sordellii TaxID=1505 RepID=UPI0005DCE7FB|nr:Crp/Fnr family transcriptional regulator [Paeniclostridium sordellii]CEO30325.1 cAMP-binding regulatory protein [[Clostridium] sordellii] [Paeniclostridium sordellii]CEP48917.1 cAMP-binding regulatory protein [[Clostridium] sordellii] [Paeniclostridium sordellii]
MKNNNYKLDHVKIFKNINNNTKVEILKYGKLIYLNQKDVLFNEKDVIDKVYILIDGKVSIFKISENGDRKIIFILNKGDMVNEINLEFKRTTISCEAFEDCLILEYNLETFLGMMKNDFELTKNIISYMERRNRRLYRQVKNSISIKIDKRLAAKLYRLANEYGKEIDGWHFIDIKITITYLADMLGCPRESLSRAMRVLETNGLVRIENKKIYVRKVEIARYFKEK